MTEQELERLAMLMTKFQDMETEDFSLYGRKVDQALAKDLKTALYAYGLKFPRVSYEEYQTSH